MINTQIKKEIERVTNGIANFTITIGLWYELVDGENIAYNCIDIRNTRNNGTIKHGIELNSDKLYPIIESNDNVKMLQLEQIKIYNYLSKHFTNVKKYEGNV